MHFSQLILVFAIALAIVYPFLQTYMLGTCRGGWQIAALAPLVFEVGIVIWGIVNDSNLTGLLPVLYAPFCTAYLSALLSIRTLFDGSTRVQQPE